MQGCQLSQDLAPLDYSLSSEGSRGRRWRSPFGGGVIDCKSQLAPSVFFLLIQQSHPTAVSASRLLCYRQLERPRSLPAEVMIIGSFSSVSRSVVPWPPAPRRRRRTAQTASMMSDLRLDRVFQKRLS